MSGITKSLVAPEPQPKPPEPSSLMATLPLPGVSPPAGGSLASEKLKEKQDTMMEVEKRNWQQSCIMMSVNLSNDDILKWRGCGIHPWSLTTVFGDESSMKLSDWKRHMAGTGFHFACCSSMPPPPPKSQMEVCGSLQTVVSRVSTTRICISVAVC